MPKHNELNINRKYQKGGYIFADSPDAPDYRDSVEFATYAAEIITVLQGGPGPMTTRQIHEALGEKANRNWTAEALDWADYILVIPGFIDRYAYEPNVQVRAVKDLTAKDANARIFAQNGRKRLEAKV
jgi:hypothetical protein